MGTLTRKRAFLIAAGGQVDNALQGDPLSVLPWPAAMNFWGTVDTAPGIVCTIRIDEIQVVNAAPLNVAVAVGVIDKLRDGFAAASGEKRALVTVFLFNPTVGALTANIQVEGVRI